MTRHRTRSTSTACCWYRLAAGAALALAVQASTVRAQGVPACTSGCETLVAQQAQYCADGLANENGLAGPTTHVFAHQCATTLHVSHALHFTPPSAPWTFNHVCIGLVGGAYGSTTTFNDPSVVLYAGPSTSPPSGTPMGMFGQGYTISGNRILVPVGNQTANSNGFWVVVTYNNVAPQWSRQLIAPRTGGRAMIKVSGFIGGCTPAVNVWWDYDQLASSAPQAANFYGSAPIIRPLRLSSAPSGTGAIIATPSGGLTTSESGLTGRFTLKLTVPPLPSAPVTLRVTTGDSSEGRLLTSGGGQVNTLTVGPFTSSTYANPRNVDVVGINDAAVDGDQNYTLNVTFESGDPLYSGVTAQVSAINRDNDSPGSVPQQQWSSLSASGPPVARRLYAMAWDLARQELLVFGGRDAFNQYFGDTWAFKNNQWTLKATGGPSPRWSPAMAYDSDRQVIVLFGGYAPVSGAYNDTWEWDGQGWTQRFSAITPGTRGDHAMAYDADLQRMVLYGGRNGATGSVYQDTYELLQTGWLQRSSTSLPGQRTGHGMVYDLDLGLTYLFGGYFGGGQIGGTYAWNGSTWSQVSNSGPVERTQHAMAFDTLRRRTVVHGGFDGPVMYGDTWEFDGAGWTNLASAGGPQRAMHNMACSGSGALLMFGGIDAGNADFNDLWAKNASVITRIYRVSGSGTGTPFVIGVAGAGWSVSTGSLVAPPGSSAGTIASIIGSAVTALPGVAGVAPFPGASHVIGISLLGSGGVLSGASAALPPSAIIQPSPPVTINPTIQEIYLTGVDCNKNGMDDTIDLLDDPTLDANGNGAMDACEPPPPPPPCIGDFDGDFVVGIGDLLTLLGAWGECDADDCPADLDGDLAVGIGDLLTVLAAWGGCDKGGDGDA